MMRWKGKKGKARQTCEAQANSGEKEGALSRQAERTKVLGRGREGKLGSRRENEKLKAHASGEGSAPSVHD